MNKNELELIKTFADETEKIMDSVNKEMASLKDKGGHSKKSVEKIISQIRLIKGNASTLKILSVEKLCRALEEIFMGLYEGALKATERVQKILALVSEKMNSTLRSENPFAEDLSVSIYILYCDKIASGELVDTREMQNAISNNIAPEKDGEGFESSDGTIEGLHTTRVKFEKINELIASYDSLITKEFRLKHQLDELRKVEEETGLASISKIRKRLSFDIESLEAQIFTLQKQIFDMRMLPISLVLNPLEDEIQAIAKEFGKEAQAEICETKIMLDKEILEQLGPLLSLLAKNTIAQGIEPPEARAAAGKNRRAKISVLCSSDTNTVQLVLKNDGRGLDYEMIRKDLQKTFPEKADEISRMNEREISAYMFKPNFFPDDNTLENALAMTEKIKGRITLEGEAKKGSQFVLRFPLSLATQQGIFVNCNGQKLLLPSQLILDVIYRKKRDLVNLSNQLYIEHEGELVPLYSLDSLLEKDGDSESGKDTSTFNIVIAEYMEQKAGIIVDDVLRYVSLTVKPLPNGFSDFPALQGIVFDEHYAIVPILNLQYIIARFKAMRGYDIRKYEAKSRKIIHKILAVDNSQTTRQIESLSLQSAGFLVDEAADGIEASDKMKEKQYDLVLSGTEMPRMDGITLLENMRRDKNYKSVPFVVIFPTKDESAQKKYATSGANAFFAKSDFNRDEMIQKVKELLHA